MKAYEIWPVAKCLGMGWHKHRERKLIHPLERVVRALKLRRPLRDHEGYDYEVFSRPHWYGKRMKDGGEDMTRDMCAIVRELWRSGAVSLVWALRAAESLQHVDPKSIDVEHTLALLRRVRALRLGERRSA